MENMFDLENYCEQSVIDEAKLVLKTNKIKKKQVIMAGEDEFYVKAKVTSSLNYVRHVKLHFGDKGNSLLGFECDCEACMAKARFCKYCVALAMDYCDNAEDVAKNKENELQKNRVDENVALDNNCQNMEIVNTQNDKRITNESEIEQYESISEVENRIDEDCEEKEEWEKKEEWEEDDNPIHEIEILFGEAKETYEQVWWRPNDTEQVFHTNMGIIGTMGTGKTQFTKSIVTQLYINRQNNFKGTGIGLLIFDYKGDYNETKPDFVKATNAKVLKPYKIPYNPLALNRKDTFIPLLPVHTANSFTDTISNIYNLGPKQQQVLLECILTAYEKKGICSENSNTWDKKAPTFEQVYQIYLEKSSGRNPDSLTAAMNKLHQFCIFEDNPERACSLLGILKGVVVMDLSGYDEDIQSLVVAITLDQFYSQMQARGSSKTDGRYRQLKNIILVDEADNFLSKGFPSLRKIMKEGREFGVGVILSTQSLTHFVSGNDDYSRYVLTWAIHNVNDLNRRDVEYVLKLNPKSNEIEETYVAIKGLEKHESIIKIANDQPLIVHDKPFWELYNEMNTGLEESEAKA